MQKRMIFVAGVGVGYVLGARAGRERFDQMVSRARRFWESPTVQEAAGVVQAQAIKLYDSGKQAVTNQLHRHNGRDERTPDDLGAEAWATGGSWSAPENPVGGTTSPRTRFSARAR